MTSSPAPHLPVTVVGSVNVDVVVDVPSIPAPGETVLGGDATRHPGGKGGNQAVCAALQGAEVRLVAAVGDDADGAFLRDALRRAGVGTEAVRTVARPTGTALISVDPHGENAIVVAQGANGAVELDALPGGVVSVCCEIPVAVAAEALRRARAAGALTVLNPSPMPADPAVLVRLADVVVVNATEAHQLTGVAVTDQEALVTGLATLGCAAAVVTLGPDGALVIEHLDGQTPTVTAVAASRVDAVDTTGCGDAFTGSVLVGLSAGRSLVDACRRAALVAGFAATRRGAQSSYPGRAEIEALEREAAGGSVA